MQNYSAHNDTLPYVCSAETAEGPVQILTHDKVAFFFRNPHASVMPAGMVRSKYAGCTLLWKTSDPSLLADLHDEVGRLVDSGRDPNDWLSQVARGVGLDVGPGLLALAAWRCLACGEVGVFGPVEVGP